MLTLDRVILASQTTALRVRYTLPAGAYQPTIGQAINGSGEPGQLFAKDSYVFGSMYDTRWGSVERSFTSFDRAVERNTAVSGGWQFDSTMNGWGAAEFDEAHADPHRRVSALDLAMSGGRAHGGPPRARHLRETWRG